MENLLSLIPDHLVKALGWTLIHSIWQAFLLFFVVKFLINIWHVRSSNARYWISVIGLLSVFAWSLYTFNYYFKNPAPASAVPVNIIWPATGHAAMEYMPLENNPFSSWGNQALQFIQSNLQWVVALWMLGFLLFNIRVIGGYLYLHKLKSQYIQPLSESWQRRFLALKEHLGITKPVQLYESWKTSVPVAMGYLKPVVLLPIGLVTNLSVQQVEAILAHELAHIQRSDFLVNLIQQFLGAIYFFNPGFLMLSTLIGRERENCCDDLVIDQGNDKMAYARALQSIQQCQIQQPMLAMSLASGKKPLLFRIQRLFNQSVQVPGKKEKIIPAVILLLSLSCVSWYSLTLKDKVKKQAVAERVQMHFTRHTVNQPINALSDTTNISKNQQSQEGKDVEVNIDKHINVDNGVSASRDVEINIDSVAVAPKGKVKTKVVYQFKNSAAPGADSVKTFNFTWSSDIDHWPEDVLQPGFQFTMPPMPPDSEDLPFGMMAPPVLLDSPAVNGQPAPPWFGEGDQKALQGLNGKLNDIQKKAMHDYMEKNHVWRMKMDSMRQQAMRQVEKSEAYKALQEQMRAQQEKVRAEQEKMQERMAMMRKKAMKDRELAMRDFRAQRGAMAWQYPGSRMNFDSEIESHKEALEKHEEELKALEDFRKSMTKALRKDGYLGKNEELKNLSIDHDNISVNGQKIKNKDKKKYLDMVQEQKGKISR